MNPVYDVVIVGGGMTGATLALALSGHGLRTALIEAAVPRVEAQPSYDDRAIALADGTRVILDSLGVWEALATRVGPIRDIHVSDRGQFGFVRLDAAAAGVANLGYVVTARDLGAALLEGLRRLPDVEVLAPAQVTAVTTDASGVHLRLLQDELETGIEARLLVAADGAESFVRETLGLPTRRWDYHEHAVTANITPGRHHQGRAFERFTEQGPVALLPLPDQRCGLVWTVGEAQLDEVLALDDRAFLAAFQARFGYRLGRFSRVGRRASYPLRFLRATEFTADRVAVIGNAAHTLHPVAGQGFNLGIRDVAALAELVVEAQHADKDPGAPELLRAFADWRRGDQQAVALATDSLVRIFRSPLPPVRLLRNLGMLALDGLPPAKRLLARAAMGRLGRLPALARGVRHG